MKQHISLSLVLFLKEQLQCLVEQEVIPYNIALQEIRAREFTGPDF